MNNNKVLILTALVMIFIPGHSGGDTDRLMDFLVRYIQYTSKE